MATPRLDDLILTTREVLGDLRVSNSGLTITLASQDGQRFSSAEMTHIVCASINTIFTQVYGSLGALSATQKAQALCTAYPQYAVVSVDLTAIAGNSEHIYGTLPADFAYLVSARIRAPGAAVGQRIRINTTMDEVNAVLEGINTSIMKSPKGYVAGTLFHAFKNDSANPFNFTGPANDVITIDYFSLQPTVTQGGATDIKAPASMDAAIRAVAKTLADGY